MYPCWNDVPLSQRHMPLSCTPVICPCGDDVPLSQRHMPLSCALVTEAYAPVQGHVQFPYKTLLLSLSL